MRINRTSSSRGYLGIKRGTSRRGRAGGQPPGQDGLASRAGLVQKVCDGPPPQLSQPEFQKELVKKLQAQASIDKGPGQLQQQQPAGGQQHQQALEDSQAQPQFQQPAEAQYQQSQQQRLSWAPDTPPLTHL